MEAKYKYLILIVILALAITSAYFFTLPKKEKPKKELWSVTITYPLNQTMKKGSGSLGLSSYALTMAISFFSKGRLNETSIHVGPLGTVPRGNVTVVLSLSGGTGVMVFTKNSTIRLQGKDQNGLFAATDRVILAIAGEYALDLDESGNYLIVIHPDQGNKVGLQWLGKIPISLVKRVPIYLYDSKEVNLRKMLLGPYSPENH